MSTLIYAVDYNNIKSPRASTSSRRTSTSTSDSHGSKFSLKAALEQLKPTEEKITPSGIYSPIIKRGSLFSGLRSKKTPSQSRKHSQSQARVDAALLR